MVVVGIISDTHGLMRQNAIAALQGCDQIIHAGDIGGSKVINELSKIAPVTAIKGNNDKDRWACNFKEVEILELANQHIYIIHNLKDLNSDPVTEGFRVVVSGHTHQPNIESREGVLYLNPGSAGPRRFLHPISVARLTIKQSNVEAKIIELDD